MKKLLLFLLLITITRFYSQNESFILKYNTLIQSEEIKFDLFEKKLPTNIDEIINYTFSIIESNSEGKFLTYFPEGSEFSQIEKTSEINSNLNTTLKKSIIIVLNDHFLQSVTQKFSNTKNESNKPEKHFFTYNKELVTDKLNKKIYNTDDVSIQIGKNIYEYINKLYKSDVDKTFANQLNLLVVNF